MWANKTGRMSCIGHSSSAPVWTQEFQADSYAGAVPSSLGGSPQPSIQIYNSVLASWTQSHSPGSQRAQVFTNGFDNGLDDYCGQVGALARSDDTAPESDARFHELLSMDAWTQLREIGQR